jgi:hypothetical protein
MSNGGSVGLIQSDFIVGAPFNASLTTDGYCAELRVLGLPYNGTTVYVNSSDISASSRVTTNAKVYALASNCAAYWPVTLSRYNASSNQIVWLANQFLRVQVGNPTPTPSPVGRRLAEQTATVFARADQKIAKINKEIDSLAKTIDTNSRLRGSKIAKLREDRLTELLKQKAALEQPIGPAL